MGWGGYEDEGPWNFVVLDGQVVDEEVEDAGDDDGGEQLRESEEVEGECRVGRRLPRYLAIVGHDLLVLSTWFNECDDRETVM